MKNIPASVYTHMEKICARLKAEPKLEKLYRNCYPNTLETTAEILPDGSTFLYSGDLPAMWLRDSTAQVTQYLPIAAEDEEMRQLLRGLIKKQFFYVGIEPYANAFNIAENDRHWATDDPYPGKWVWERKYEVDSLCAPLRLSYLYWKTTNDSTIVDDDFVSGVRKIVALWRREQNHSANSEYYFARPNPYIWFDTLSNEGKGAPVNITGMTWSGFRPSDDACTFGYLIPSEMFAVVSLRQMSELLRACRSDTEELCREMDALREEIDRGIQTYGTYLHPKYGRIYAYETDGFGNYLLVDDANVPSLLSAPYLGYCTEDDPIYQNTRRFLLSHDNPFYHEGKAAKGVGSPHISGNCVWHIALCMQGLTAKTNEEKREILDMLISTDADLGYMHEGFDADDPTIFTREWFAWSNSLFAEFVEHALQCGVIRQ